MIIQRGNLTKSLIYITWGSRGDYVTSMIHHIYQNKCDPDNFNTPIPPPSIGNRNKSAPEWNSHFDHWAIGQNLALQKYDSMRSQGFGCNSLINWDESGIVRVIFENSDEITILEDVFWRWMKSWQNDAYLYHEYLVALKVWMKSPVEVEPPDEVEECLPKPTFHTFRHRW